MTKQAKVKTQKHNIELRVMPSPLLRYFATASTVAKSCNCKILAHKRVVFTMESPARPPAGTNDVSHGGTKTQRKEKR